MRTPTGDQKTLYPWQRFPDNKLKPSRGGLPLRVLAHGTMPRYGMNPPISPIERGWLAGLAVATLLVAFSGIGMPLLEPTEARYALIPLEMLESGNWLSPKLFGEPYPDKPPLLYWLVMLSYGLFGVSDGAARVPASACALALPWVAWAWLRACSGPRTAMVCALVLCFSPRLMYYQNMLAMDGMVGLSCLATLASLHAGLSGQRIRILWLAIGWASTMAGILAKGPVVVVPVAPAALMALAVSGRWIGIAALSVWLATVAASAALAFMALDSASPGFGFTFLVRHNVERFSTPFDHDEPYWYHLPGLGLGLLPWLPIAVMAAMRNATSKTVLPNTGPWVWLACSLGFSFLFFSIAGSKRPSYATAFLPQACLLAGLLLDAKWPGGWTELSRRNPPGATVTVWGLVLALAGVGWVGFALGWSSWGWILPLTAVAGAASCVMMRHGARWDLAMVLACALMVSGQWVLLWGHHETLSTRKSISWLRTQSPEATLACFPRPYESVEFYARDLPRMVFSESRAKELADWLQGDQSAVLVAKGNRLPLALSEALGRPPVLATPYKSTPWLMRLNDSN
ncbi:MAG: ArnT family glycosyltransferase [Planctomycetota bacterium]